MFLDLRDPRFCVAVLIDPEPRRRDLFQNLLADRGLTIRSAYPVVQQAAGDLDGLDLAIIHVGFAKPDDVGALTSLRKTCDAPILALTEETDPTVVEGLTGAGADEVAPVGVKADRITFGAAAAIATRRRVDTIDKARERAEAALRDHKLLTRAKGILMTRQHLSEAEAHRRVQELSMERNIPIGEMVRQIVDAEALLT